MSLEIKFTASPHGRIKPHFVVDDGCKFFLDDNFESISEAQQSCIEGYNDPKRGKHLFYFNKVASDMWISESSPLELHCPTCKKDYVVTREEYDEAWRKFEENQKSAGKMIF